MVRKVLHLRTVSGRGGGPEKTLLNSPRFLRDAYQLRLAYIRPAGDTAYDMLDRAARLGVSLADIPERGPLDPRTVWRLAAEIQDFRPDLLHAHDYKTNVLAVALGQWFRLPVMTTAHGYVTRGGRLEAYYWVDRWALRRMDHVVTVSEDLYELMLSLGIPRSRCSLVENAIDTSAYRRRESVETAQQRWGLAPGRLTIGAVGRLSAEKGFDLLIQAADQLLRQGFDFELLIVGEGTERPRLEALISALNRTDRVRLMGYVTDTIQFYEALDVFALSSLREGLPNVLLEAMAMEIPVVASRVAGVPRLVRHEENGLLVDPGSVEQLADALARLLRDAGLRRNLGAEGRATVEKSFSFEGRMQKICTVYDRLLNGN